jgi:TetR/AcrR family transcriptional repressor of lmrAB and yxaGH operons
MARSATTNLPDALPTRDRIVQSAVQLFQANGYAATGVSAIIDSVQIPKGSFYHHFSGGKEAVAVAAMDWLSAEISQYLDALEAAGATGADMMFGLAKYAAAGLNDPQIRRGSLVAVLTAEAIPGSASIQSAVENAISKWTAKLAAGFRRAGEADADAKAEASLALLEGATMLARVHGRPELVSEIIGRSVLVRR